MTINLSNVVVKACQLLNKNELAEYSQIADVTQLPNTSQYYQRTDLTADLNRIKMCLAEIYSEIASDYFALYYTESVNATNNEIAISALTKPFKAIKELVNANNQSIDYTVENNKIVCENGTHQITYRYVPNQADIEEDLQDFQGKISENLFAYGVCALYSLLDNNTNHYNTWETKFKQGLFIAGQKTDGLRIKPRRWL